MGRGGGIDAGADSSTTAIAAAWLELVASWVSAQPTAGHAAGLTSVREALRARLERLGLTVRLFTNEGAAPVIVASRPPEIGTSWVGLFGHYDVESAGDGWSSDPFAVRVADGRAFGRGVADNLGPLALRLLALEELLGRGVLREALPGLVWIIQGEEEIGSPWAHTLFPRLELPAIHLWLEETGYFEGDGAQRVLARRIPSLLAPALDRIRALASAEGRALHVLDRYLNKAFGESRCPCLTHLVGEAPYLAIGPNDTRSRIHASDESLPLGTLSLSSAQLLGVLHEVARCG
jgi:acetylornithine deacetylase/succinyl-diaminopimelate desuccinylase-like protein